MEKKKINYEKLLLTEADLILNDVDDLGEPDEIIDYDLEELMDVQ